MMPWQWALQALRNYAKFDGRALRPEFWWFHLFAVGAMVLAVGIDALLPSDWLLDDSLGPASLALTMALLLPSLGAYVRRLHDIDRSGWYVLLLFLPYVGALWLLFWLARRGVWGPNSFGEHPLGVAGPAALVEPRTWER